MKLKLKDFERAVARTRLQPQAIEMARLHLVEGLSLEAAGKAVLGPLLKGDGVTPASTKQRVHKAVLSVRKALDAASGHVHDEQPRLTRTSKEQFAELAALTGLGDDAREMARRYFVDGLTMEEAGRPFGVDRRRVNLAVQSIRRAFGQLPGSSVGGRVKASLDLPAPLVGALTEFGVALDTCKVKKRRDEAVGSVTDAVLSATKRLS